MGLFTHFSMELDLSLVEEFDQSLNDGSGPDQSFLDNIPSRYQPINFSSDSLPREALIHPCFFIEAYSYVSFRSPRTSFSASNWRRRGIYCDKCAFLLAHYLMKNFVPQFMTNSHFSFQGGEPETHGRRAASGVWTPDGGFHRRLL